MYDKKDVIKINLSQVVQALGIQLEDKGNYRTAQCPYHNDEHASFIVYDNLDKSIQGIWQCFTCGVRGDSIDLVMKEKKLTFSEAVDWIGETFDLTKTPLTPEQARMYALRAEIAPILVEANRWFREQKNEWFFEYLDGRSFSEQTIKEFDFGYAPNSVIELKKHLYDKGFTDEQLVGSGLFVNKPSGVEPVFYGRLMIPIKDKSSNIVGFAGRTQNQYDTSKYITTTAVFTKKSKVAYGLNRVRASKLPVTKLYITEGNLDVPKLMQNTDEKAVSVMGTSITHAHIKEICASLPDLNTIVIALDGDDAGRSGVKKFVDKVYSSEEFTYKKKIDFYVFDTPDGEDIDSLVTDNVEEFHKLSKELTHVIDYTIKALREEFDKEDKTKNDKYVAKCLEIIASVEQFRVSGFIVRLAELSGYNIDRLRKELYVYRIRQRNITKELYEKKVLRYLVDNMDDLPIIETELGMPLSKVLSERGQKILMGDFAKYATKLLYVSVLDTEEINYDDAVFFGLLLVASNIFELMIEYENLSPEATRQINKKTDNAVTGVDEMYKNIMKNIIRRIDG